LILKADSSKAFEVHVDCDFAGNWVKEDALNDPSMAKSIGYIISYGGCPVIWVSKLQTEVVLSSTESEYVSLSESLWIVTVVMNLLREMKSFDLPIIKTTPMVFCKLFEDNAGAIHLAKVPKMRPRKGTSIKNIITSVNGSSLAQLISNQLTHWISLQI
jgi:hypothetical protein